MLFLQHRIPTMTLGLALVDASLGLLFVIAYLKTKQGSPS
jgi:hypothetical protein